MKNDFHAKSASSEYVPDVLHNPDHALQTLKSCSSGSLCIEMSLSWWLWPGVPWWMIMMPLSTWAALSREAISRRIYVEIIIRLPLTILLVTLRLKKTSKPKVVQSSDAVDECPNGLICHAVQCSSWMLYTVIHRHTLSDQLSLCSRSWLHLAWYVIRWQADLVVQQKQTFSTCFYHATLAVHNRWQMPHKQISGINIGSNT